MTSGTKRRSYLTLDGYNLNEEFTKYWLQVNGANLIIIFNEQCHSLQDLLQCYAISGLHPLTPRVVRSISLADILRQAQQTVLFSPIIFHTSRTSLIVRIVKIIEDRCMLTYLHKSRIIGHCIYNVTLANPATGLKIMLSNEKATTAFRIKNDRTNERQYSSYICSESYKCSFHRNYYNDIYHEIIIIKHAAY